MYRCNFIYKSGEGILRDDENEEINHIPQVGEYIFLITTRDDEILYQVEHVLYFQKDDFFEVYLTKKGSKNEILKDWLE